MISVLQNYTFIDLGPDGGLYDETVHPKVIIHTTEGTSLAGAEAAFRPYPPHIGYDPVRRIKHQYVKLDHHSYALRGDESDDEYCIQVEIVGFAAQSHTWSDTVYRNIGQDVVAPLAAAINVPAQYLRFYGQDEGIVLAVADSPIRLSNSEFRSFSGWLGHQHVPAPDTHWDPGRFLIDKALMYGGTSVDEASISDRVWQQLVPDFTQDRKADGTQPHMKASDALGRARQDAFQSFTEAIKIKAELDEVKAELAVIKTMIGTGYTLHPEGNITIVANPSI